MEELNTPISIRNSNKLVALFMGGELVVENYHGINIIKLTKDVVEFIEWFNSNKK